MGGRGRAPKCLGSGHGVTVPPSQAFSAFFYTVDFLRTVMGLPVATLQQLEAAVVTICNQTWSEVRPAPPSSRAAQGAQPASVTRPDHSFALRVEGVLALSECPLQWGIHC